MSRPHLAARGWEQATIPLVLCTTLLRLGHFMNSADDGGYTDDVGSGMVSVDECVEDRLSTAVREYLERVMTRQQTWPYKYLAVDMVVHESCPRYPPRRHVSGPVRPLPRVLYSSADAQWRRRGAESRAGGYCYVKAEATRWRAGNGMEILLSIGIKDRTWSIRASQLYRRLPLFSSCVPVLLPLLG